MRMKAAFAEAPPVGRPELILRIVPDTAQS